MAAAGAVLAAIGFSFGLAGPLRAELSGETLLSEIESPYQYLRIVRVDATDADDRPAVDLMLRLDEGVLDYHSVLTEGSVTTNGKYYDIFALFPALIEKPRLRVLVLGSGAGTMSRILHGAWSDRIERVVNVELDPEVAALEERFGLTGNAAERTSTIVADGRVAARMIDEKFDLVFVDAYARQIDIPFHMATIEFFEELTERVAESGIIAINVSAASSDDAVLASIAHSMSSAFGAVVATNVRGYANIVLWARRGGGSLDFEGKKVPDLLDSALARARRVTSRFVVPGDVLELTDDHAPIERLGRREDR
jgi:spermidine synthase